jgi:hypothetical protein
MTAMTAADSEALLRRYQPQLRYDSNEAFFADSAAEWTDNPVNSLHRDFREGRPGELLAAAKPEAGQEQLSLDFLAPSRYANGEPVERTDFIGCSRRDYRDQYVALRRDRAYANRMYGRVKEDRGRVWLQYWFFYFYNDYNLAGGFGLHECDWEMVQLRMGEGGEVPDLAAYAQHRWAEVAPWGEVEKVEDEPSTPIVYVARGSHASYFSAGFHGTEAWYDLADGKRTTPKLELEIVGDEEPAWAFWPSVWGGTRARISGLETGAPTAPIRHGQWAHPAELLEGARTVRPGEAAPAPSVRVTRAGEHLELAYDFRRHPERRPDRLVVTVNSQDDSIQPRTFTFVVDTALSGTIATTVELKPTQHYDIYVSAVDAAGKPTESALTLIRPVGEREPEPVPVLPWFGRVVDAIRRFFGRA